MIELNRVVEHQSELSSYRATRNEERAVQLELLIESTKPAMPWLSWHTLVATPFRYAPPHQEARFRPPYGKNVFYASKQVETALYEHAYHFMKQRAHLNYASETGYRTLFAVNANDTHAVTLDAVQHAAILHQQDYAASHAYIEQHPTTSFILYPSCRDPEQRQNAAILDINHLAKDLNHETSIRFFYDNSLKRLTWIDYSVYITRP